RGEGRTESGHAPLVSTGRDGRGRGRERTAVAAWPGEWRQVARWSGLVAAVLRAACFVVVPGGRRDARLGRPVVLRPVRPECPAGAPRSVRGQPP
ncbi:hypothetical protein HSX37_19160, partial|nr:hypothetical protein [Dendrosporobacter quercicolus DSM 1736]